ncbi:MAG: hypothetical protein Q7L55_10250 [Actinomycetota bacterium]|nr:hypothetical protein [Actinomycetota bacterium]
MRILFAMLHPGYLRNYESTIIELSQRGHHITVDFAQREKQRIASPLQRLKEEVPGIDMRDVGILSRGKDQWAPVADALRMAVDVNRYADPRYSRAVLLRDRMVDKFQRLPLPASEAITQRILHMQSDRARAHFQRAAIRMDMALPLKEHLIDTLELMQPDVIVVTPIVNAGSRQVDVVRHAQALGIPVAVAVASWDNLSNKGLLRCNPDRVFVWNEAQRTEAVEMHGIDPNTIGVTGAQLFDHWFTWKPTRSRDSFVHGSGLDPSKPYFLWLASSPFIGGDREVEYVMRWVSRLRTQPGAIADVGVMIRPHPQSTAPWTGVDPSTLGNTVIFPRLGANPIDSDSRQDFFESIYYSAGVVGINSSAMIESAIVGKAVFTVTAPEFAEVQGGTIHFSHLEDALLTRADSDDDLFRLLSDSMEHPEAMADKNRLFLESFIRPHGLDVSATERLASEIEDLGRRPRKTPYYGRRGDSMRRVVLHGVRLAIAAKARQQQAPFAGLPSARPILHVSGRSSISESGARVSKKNPSWQERAVDTTPHAVTADDVFESEGLAEGEEDLSLVRMVIDPSKLDQEIANQLKRIAKSDSPIIVGPWTSELGFELLYWVPFLRWALGNYGIDPGRVVSVTRGGAGPVFYAGIASKHVEIFDLMGHEQFRDELTKRWATRGGQKQSEWSPLDTELIARVEQHLGIGSFDIIHPSSMYRLFAYFWRDRMPLQMLRERLVFAPFAVPELPEELASRLPEEFDAVRFYFRPSFPDTPANRELIQRLVSRRRNERPVVLLSTGIRFDDHEEHTFGQDQNVIHINDAMTPENNLAVQAAVIARASSVFTTYGGLAYLPPYYRVPVYSFHSEAEHLLDNHQTVANLQSRLLRTRSYTLSADAQLW